MGFVLSFRTALRTLDMTTSRRVFSPSTVMVGGWKECDNLEGGGGYRPLDEAQFVSPDAAAASACC